MSSSLDPQERVTHRGKGMEKSWVAIRAPWAPNPLEELVELFGTLGVLKLVIQAHSKT